MPTSKNVMTTTQVDHPVAMVFQRMMLRTPDPYLPHAQFGQEARMPAHEGDTTKWRRWDALTASTTPLNEAEDPAPIMLSKNDISVAVKEYGRWTKISSWLKLTGLGSDQTAIVQRLRKHMQLTLDTLCRNVMVGTATSATCSNGSPTTTYLNKTDIDTAVRTILGENGEMITQRIKAGTGQGTSPIRRAFIGIAHTNMMHRLEAVQGFKHVSSYASAGSEYPGEWGSTGNVRWILTTNGYTSGGYYYNLIIGQDAYGNVNIRGGKGPLIYTPPDKTGSPLQRYSTLGWLRNYAAKILNDLFIYALLST